MGNISATLPSFIIPKISINFKTLSIVIPYAFSLAIVGSVESLLTAQSLDEIIGDKSNKISRAFDIFITIIIVGNIIVTFLETFDQLSSFSGLFKIVEIVTVFVFCVEYILRIWTANYLYPEVTAGHARLMELLIC